MLRIPYRNKLKLKKLGQLLLLALGLLFLMSVLVLVYADRMIRYDRDGAHLAGQAEELVTEPTQGKDRPLISDPVVVIQEKEAEMTDIKDLGGVYITTKMMKDMDAVTEQIRQIQEPCAVMLEMKSISGNFYYTTDFAFDNYPQGIEVDKIDALIRELRDRGFYLIASVPAFPDYAYVVENPGLALSKKGGYGWMDSRGCYWLDPSLDASVSRLMQLARDLGDRGFREICFTEFQFPNGDNYRYESELPKEQIIREQAEKLGGMMTGSDILVSIVTEGIGFPSAATRGRIYVPDVEVSQIDRYTEAYGGEGGAMEVVFLTASKDERFDAHAVLRPLLSE